MTSAVLLMVSVTRGFGAPEWACSANHPIGEALGVRAILGRESHARQVSDESDAAGTLAGVGPAGLRGNLPPPQGSRVTARRTTPSPASTTRQALMDHGTNGPIRLFRFAEGQVRLLGGMIMTLRRIALTAALAGTPVFRGGGMGVGPRLEFADWLLSR